MDARLEELLGRLTAPDGVAPGRLTEDPTDINYLPDIFI